MGALNGELTDRQPVTEPLEEEAVERTLSEPAAGCAVWVDGTSAVVVRWTGHATVSHVEDEVPARHRSTGHIRHDPAVRHGGGGIVAEQVERDRMRHRAAHLRRVAALVPDTGPVLILGPGSARLELEHAVAAADRRCRRDRSVRSEASGRLTDRELIARLRARIGASANRRVVGRV